MADNVIRAYKALANRVMSAPVAISTCVGPGCPPSSPWGWNNPEFTGNTVERLPAKPLRFIINTNDDPDHVGGNAKVRLSGLSFTGGNITGTITDSDRGAAMLSHQNALNRMSGAVEGFPRLESDALPTESFEKEMYKLSQFFNGEGVQMFHQTGHSDGDVMVWFRYSDVIAAGDVYSSEHYPVIDVKRGGSIDGELAALNQMLDVAYAEFRSQGGTYIIPSHGRLSDVADVAYYRNMISIIRDRIQDAIKKGMTLEQVKAAKLTLDYDGRWGATTGPWTTSMFVEAAYRSLSAKK
jgi:glyoxylase-like metal-dependent hydrolase (beta-lactamase superfamily II)